MSSRSPENLVSFGTHSMDMPFSMLQDRVSRAASWRTRVIDQSASINKRGKQLRS